MSNIPIIGSLVSHVQSQRDTFNDERVPTSLKVKLAVADVLTVGGFIIYLVGIGMLIHGGQDTALGLTLGGISALAAVFAAKRFNDQAEVLRGIRLPKDVYHSNFIGPGVVAPK